MLDRWAMWLCIFVLSLCYHHGNAVVRALDLTDAEIKDLAQKMRDADYDRPKFDTEFLVNFHDYKNKSINYASKPLFNLTQPSLLERPVYKALLDLTEGFFTPRVGIAEMSSEKKDQAQLAFINNVTNSSPFMQLYNVLREKNHTFATGNATLSKSLTDLWFGMFSRSQVLDSSTFEHVFLGEIKKGQVIGMHNWVVMNKYENNETDINKTLHYRGYIEKRADIIMGANFLWGRRKKPYGSFFIGTSPAFDFSLFTMCILARRDEKCEVIIDECPVSVVSRAMQWNGTSVISTVFPIPGNSSWRCDANFERRKMLAASLRPPILFHEFA
ncbi:unnamed protein product [Bursaphelenchus xylophilus]|nr:unnamed protein product [Bursaphelenchus xylophilus]CAG9104110.1 unnamed protein product [Bursaphelenchus xylophilus]